MARWTAGAAITAETDWADRAIWWNPTWRYRVPVDIAAGAKDTFDGVVTLAMNWVSILAAVGIIGDKTNIDANSLRLVEYTAGGHIIPAYQGSVVIGTSGGYNRFDRCPIAPVSGDLASLIALIPCKTAASSTRHFFLYFDTTGAPKSAYAYPYLTVTSDGSGVSIQRTGPGTEVTLTGVTMVWPLTGGLNTGGTNHTLWLPAIGNSASFITGITPTLGDVTVSGKFTAALSGTNWTGSQSVECKAMIIPVPPSTTSNRQAYLVKGSITITPTADVAVGGGAILHLRKDVPGSGLASAWIDTPAPGTALNSGVTTTLPLGTLVGSISGNSAIAHRIDSLTVPGGFVFGSTITVTRATNTITIDLVNPGGAGTWHSGDSVTFTYTTFVYAVNTGASVSMMDDLVNGAEALTPTLTPANASAYSLGLLNAQLVYYEGKAWDWVDQWVLSHPWGPSWNITFAYDTNSGAYSQAHDNDSSMGAGAMLYAACLKAAQTGDARYYRIADAYANYFIQIEAEAVAEYGSTRSGMIPYGYNGGPGSTSFNNNFPEGTAAAGTVCNLSSIDQMCLSALGLWAYRHLNASKISYKSQVEALLGRMALFANTGDTNLVANPGLMNMRTILGLGAGWTGTQSNLPANGSNYALWLANTTADINTGAVANSYFVSAVQDRILAHKDATKLQNRTKYAASDIGTAARGLYPVIAASFSPIWGYGLGGWEWPVLGTMRSATNGLVWDGGSPTSHVVFAGGTRDALSGRQAEYTMVLALGLAEYSGSSIPVQNNAAYMTYDDACRHLLHSSLGSLQDDNGAIVEAALGILGRASSVTYNRECVDEHGYTLAAMALYHAVVLKDTVYPFPRNGHDYVQGIGESDGRITLHYLGDVADYQQSFALGRDDAPLHCTGLLATPTLTFGTGGASPELAGRTITLPVTMPLEDYAAATIEQLPFSPALSTGTLTLAPGSWTTGKAGLFPGVTIPLGVTLTLTFAVERHAYVVVQRGKQLVWGRADGNGALTLVLEGDGGAVDVGVDVDAPTLPRRSYGERHYRDNHAVE